MNILLVLPTYEKTDQNKYIYELFQRVLPLGEVFAEVVAPGRDTPLVQQFHQLGMKIHLSNSPKEEGSESIEPLLESLLEEQGRFDLVLCFDVFPSKVLKSVGTIQSTIPCVHHVSGVGVKSSPSLLQKIVQSFASTNENATCSAYIVEDEATCDQLKESLPSDRLVHLVPRGVDAVKTHPVSQTRKRFYRELLNIQEDKVLVFCSMAERAEDSAEKLSILESVLNVSPKINLVLSVPEQYLNSYRQLKLMRIYDGNLRLVSSVKAIQQEFLASMDCYLELPGNSCPRNMVIQAMSASLFTILPEEVALSSSLFNENVAYLYNTQAMNIDVGLEILIDSKSQAQDMALKARESILEQREMSIICDMYMRIWQSVTK